MSKNTKRNTWISQQEQPLPTRTMATVSNTWELQSPPELTKVDKIKKSFRSILHGIKKHLPHRKRRSTDDDQPQKHNPRVVYGHSPPGKIERLAQRSRPVSAVFQRAQLLGHSNKATDVPKNRDWGSPEQTPVVKAAKLGAIAESQN